MKKAIPVPTFVISGLAAASIALVFSGCGSKAPPPIAPMAAPAGTATPPATTPAAAAPAPEPFSLKEGEQLVAHKVQKGDTLWELAQQYQTRVSRIKSANNLTSDMIVEGRTLQIPTKMAAATPTAAPTAAPSTTPAPAPAPAPATTPTPAPGPTPAPAPAPSSAPPSLNFGTPPSSGGGVKIQDN